ncbi:MAG: TraM recognition domain-containing protein [Lachnospiraceae bacterium]
MKANPNSFAVRQYCKFRVAVDRTLASILITANAKIGVFDTSDTDRSMDLLANLFFTQAMNELCTYADEKCDATQNKLPVDVRFILGDFATNVRIDEFPRMIASIRSRGISTMLMIQSEAQLTADYGYDDKTIIGNCDTYVYLGGNDVATAKEIINDILSKHTGKTVEEINKATRFDNYMNANESIEFPKFTFKMIVSGVYFK